MPYIRLPDGTWKKVNDGAPVDSTLKISGAAADAKAVGTALAETVKHNAVQELTDAQKVQARTNIGAGEPQIQTDWNQNDETAADYIKNRTHYEETNLIDITGLEYEKSVYSSESSYDFSLPLELGQVWNIWHDSSRSGNPSLHYENLEVQEDDNGELYIGDLHYTSIPFYARKEELVFSTSFMKMIKPSIFKAVGVSGTYVEEHIVHQLDQKFVPNADWSVNDENEAGYIKNRTHYETPEVATNLLNSDGTLKLYPWELDKAYTLRVDGVDYRVDRFINCGYMPGIGQDIWYLGAATGFDGTTVTVMSWDEYPFSIHGPQSYITNGSESLTIKYADGTTDHTIEIIEKEKKIKHLDPKFIKDMYYEKDIDELKTYNELSDIINIAAEANGITELVVAKGLTADVVNGLTFRVVVDGVVYDNVPVYRNCNVAGGTTYGIGDFYFQGNWYVNDYGFCCNPHAPTVCNSDIFPNGIKTIEVYTHNVELKQIAPKYIKDMYYEREVTVFEEQTISGFAVMNDPIYAVAMENILSPEEGKECTVEWDGVAYDVVWETHPEEPLIYAGNENYAIMTSGGDIPFAIVVDPIENLMFFVTESTAESHTVCVKELGIHYIDPKYIKDMYYDNGVAITEVVPETTVKIGQDFPTELNLSNITVGNTYIVTWNGEFYECVCYQFMGAKVIGNVNGFDGVGGNGEPFCIVNLGGVTRMMALEAGTYTISITEYAHDIKQLDTKYLPIIKENKEVVFEMDDVENDTEYRDESFKTLLGKYSITVDDKLYTLFFNAIEDFSLAENEIIYIETWNGGIYISFADGETHSVKIKKIIEVIDDKYLPQSDWNQNDENASDYIKNRTHYEYEKLTPLKDPITVDCNTATTKGNINCYVNSAGLYAYWLGWDYLDGQTIRIIFDGEPYNVLITSYNEMASLKSYPFKLEFIDQEDRFYVYALESGTHTLEFYSIDDYELKQLDEKFIPDTIARTDNFINGIKLTDTVTGLKYLVQIQDGTLVTTLSIEDLLIDFDYTTNENGTYTLTNWKQTLNGEESTELIIPEYPKIIL